MFCGFENVPMILRLYGQGRSLPRGTPEYADLLQTAFDNQEPTGARQIIRLEVDMVQTSCGYGVPLFDYKEERPTLLRWAEAKGEDGPRRLPPARRTSAASTASPPASAPVGDAAADPAPTDRP